eukprot:TRINITY_DN65833_c0_g1_i1.p1 TRINITY_DN65833_c0_g1~~TRINITY_DN65833_c0_g1_i1.p1  ORF type:complete len:469 (+),score=66.57 TRINITY_DN65833_c0_g1_i1:76-1407(+)
MGLSGSKDRSRHGTEDGLDDLPRPVGAAAPQPHTPVTPARPPPRQVTFRTPDAHTVSLALPSGTGAGESAGRLLLKVDGQTRRTVGRVRFNPAVPCLHFPEHGNDVQLPRVKTGSSLLAELAALCDHACVVHEGFSDYSMHGQDRWGSLRSSGGMPRSPRSPCSPATSCSVRSSGAAFATQRTHFVLVGGARLSESANPGCWAVPDAVVGTDEAVRLHREAQQVLRLWGADITDARWSHSGQARGAQWSPRVTRATGGNFSDVPTQAPCAWGHGADFDEQQLPPSIRKLVARLSDTPPLRPPGKLRDVTITYHESCCIGFEPSPAAAQSGGDRVCIVGLLSDTVLTLVPPDVEVQPGMETFGTQSWSPRDIDCRLAAGRCVILDGPACRSWRLGTRFGARRTGSSGKQVLCDWFGVAERLVARGDKHLTISFAFDAPEPPAAG